MAAEEMLVMMQDGRLPSFPMLVADLPLFALWALLAFLATLPLWRDEPALKGKLGLNPAGFELLFFGAVFLTLLACRAPVLVFNHELNVDECQFVAQALGYWRDPTPFTQDGHTCGPLNYWVLMWPAALGWPITYFMIRLTGLFFIWGTTFFAFRTVTIIAGRAWAYLITLPLISFYCFAYQPGFVHYASEIFPSLLLAAAAYLLALLWQGTGVRSLQVYLLGFLLGATPFAKMQGGPQAVFLFAVAGALLLFAPGLRGPGGTRPWRAIAGFILGGATIPVFLGVWLVSVHLFGEAFYRYIVVNLSYSAQLWIKEPHPLYMVVYEFARNGPQFTIYFLDLAAASALALVVLAWHRDKQVGAPWLVGLGLALVYLALACYAVLKPGQAFCHYELFLPVPVLLFAAWVARGWLKFSPDSAIVSRRPQAMGLLLLMSFFTLPLYVFEQRVLPYLSEPRPGDPVAVYIKTVTTPHDTISNWGYNPQYYVDTQLPPGVRDYSTLFEIFPGDQFDYFRAGYVADVKRNRPKVIVDSVGEFYMPTWIHPLEKARAAAYPPLAQVLADLYQPPVEITTRPDRPPVLVYVRKSE